MATVNISITQEAHARLSALRKGKESFSEIIDRLTRKQDLMKFAGILSKETADRIEEHIRKRRAMFDKERLHRRKELVRELQRG